MLKKSVLLNWAQAKIYNHCKSLKIDVLCLFSIGPSGPIVRAAGESWRWSLGRIQSAGCVFSLLQMWNFEMMTLTLVVTWRPLLSGQLSRHPDDSERFSRYGYSPSPPLSYFSPGTEVSSSSGLTNTQLNRVSPPPICFTLYFFFSFFMLSHWLFVNARRKSKQSAQKKMKVLQDLVPRNARTLIINVTQSASAGL